jgi:uncharacterized membrane protein
MHSQRSGFAVAAGVWLGLGLLQWHHMLTSAGYRADSVGNLKLNTLWDGLFHAFTYILLLIGLARLWSAHQTQQSRRSWRGRICLRQCRSCWGVSIISPCFH